MKDFSHVEDSEDEGASQQQRPTLHPQRRLPVKRNARAMQAVTGQGLLARVDLGEVVKLTVEVILVVRPRPHLLALRDLPVEPNVDRDVPQRN